MKLLRKKAKQLNEEVNGEPYILQDTEKPINDPLQEEPVKKPGLFCKAKDKVKDKTKREKKPKEPKPEKEPWDGYGIGIWPNIKRWWYTRMMGYVILRTFDVFWDASNPKKDDMPYDCSLSHKLIRKKDLPPEAVHCTGEPHTFSIDKAQIRYEFHDEGFRATDAWLYLEFNGFDDCLSKKWTEIDHINPTKLMFILGAIAVGIVVVVMFLR